MHRQLLTSTYALGSLTSREAKRSADMFPLFAFPFPFNSSFLALLSFTPLCHTLGKKGAWSIQAQPSLCDFITCLLPVKGQRRTLPMFSLLGLEMWIFVLQSPYPTRSYLVALHNALNFGEIIAVLWVLGAQLPTKPDVNGEKSPFPSLNWHGTIAPKWWWLVELVQSVAIRVSTYELGNPASNTHSARKT